MHETVPRAVPAANASSGPAAIRVSTPSIPNWFLSLHNTQTSTNTHDQTNRETKEQAMMFVLCGGEGKNGPAEFVDAHMDAVHVHAQLRAFKLFRQRNAES
jgi:hypothetical protein